MLFKMNMVHNSVDSGPQFCGPGVGLTQLNHYKLEIMLMQYELNRKVFKEVLF